MCMLPRMIATSLRRAGLLALGFVAGCTTKAPDDREIKVAAAADLARAFEEAGKAFEAKSGKKVTLTFGSSGLLAKQIAEGAPFDLFAAANASFADDAVKSGRCRAETKALYARGRIVIWTRKGQAKVGSVAELAEARFAKVAIANPEHAPYGRAAREALEKAGVWEQVKPRLVFGENVAQTLQYAQTGNAEAAIVALSLAIGTDGESTTIADTEHAPLDQALVVCGSGPRAATAQDFAVFVGSPAGRTIMNRYGFVLPGEAIR
jgi:molybdate transport system substrate-binding protein